MKQRDLRNLLLEQPVPGEHTAEERTWDVVRQAFLARERIPRERHVPWKLLAALGVIAAGVAIGVTAGASIVDWTRDKLGRDRVVGVTGEEEVEPVLVTLPAPGQILVTAPNGVWVVNEDGSKRFVGEYAGATWSPNAQFVAAWNDSELVALDPTLTDDNVHWALARENINNARWSPSGFRVAYLSGSALRVVVGTGADDRQLEPRVAPVAPAWRPGQEHVLAYADRRGRVLVVETDSGRVQWRTPRLQPPIDLAWSADGQRLIVLSEQRLRVFRAPRELIADLRIPRRLYTATGLAPRPGSDEIAYAVYSERTGQGTVLLYNGRFSRPLFSGAGRFEDLAWSPDGRLLLVPWAAADQWLFIPAEGQARVQANADIAGQFAPGEGENGSAGGFPRVEGWCCPEDEPLPPPVDTGAADTGAGDTGQTETGAESGG
jgi:hypothetical protein